VPRGATCDPTSGQRIGELPEARQPQRPARHYLRDSQAGLRDRCGSERGDRESPRSAVAEPYERDGERERRADTNDYLRALRRRVHDDRDREGGDEAERQDHFSTRSWARRDSAHDHRTDRDREWNVREQYQHVVVEERPARQHREDHGERE